MTDMATQAVALLRMDRLPEAETACRRAMKIRPGQAELMALLAEILARSGRPAEAVRELEKALARRPDFVEAAAFAATLYDSLNQPVKAERYWRQVATRRPSAPVWFNLGNVLRRLNRQTEAIACYAKAHALAPDDATILGALVARKQALCDWEGLDTLMERLVALVAAGRGGGVQPLRLLAIPATDAVYQRCARDWSARMAAPTPAPLFASARVEKAVLTIGYLSADYHQHATAHLAAGLFPLHDRTRFRVLAYSLGPDDGSPMRKRLEAGFDAFHDCATLSSEAIATRIAADGIDILVDLKGHTRDARPDILARRPASLQVNYLGYPGTMGMSCIDYILADPVVLPFACQPWYDERIVHLPHCYQVNDRERPLPIPEGGRAAHGLPPSAKVAACFNAPYKISPAVFSLWMRILTQVADAVLWLLAPEPEVERALRHEAERRGVAGDRLIFAPHAPVERHLARYALADLVLDTLPYNAHTTGSDALWMGCPLVTCVGQGFAGRVGASLLAAVGLSELATPDLEAYESLAVTLLRDPARLAHLRAHLAAGRERFPLFDTRAFAGALERAYRHMWDCFTAGKPPAPFSIPPDGDFSPF